MIVDDNAAMRKVLMAVFTSAGHEVVGAFEDGNGLEEKIRQISPDVVCLDYLLPGRDGLAILKSIQSFAPQLDVLFMTASEESGLEEKAADAGASGFIRKPFSQTQIVEELRVVAETRRLAKQATATTGASKGTNPAAGSGQRGTAVIADDNGSIRLILNALLKESRMTVVQSVTNGAEAVQAARNHQPTVLFLDINMPVMGGMEALPLILEASPNTSVIMVTGCVDKLQVTQAAGLGAVGYIIKPLRPAYVENFIRKLLGA
ncbi:MAG TPA: response regulator [Azonexus sp.]|nr:response regulator [Azonexus sp.]